MTSVCSIHHHEKKHKTSNMVNHKSQRFVNVNTWKHGCQPRPNSLCIHMKSLENHTLWYLNNLQHSYWLWPFMTICRWFTHWTRWFSKAYYLCNSSLSESSAHPPNTRCLLRIWIIEPKVNGNLWPKPSSVSSGLFNKPKSAMLVA